MIILDFQSSMVSRALTCIVNQMDSIKDSYTTALVAYTLTLANHSQASDMIRALRSKAITKGKKNKQVENKNAFFLKKYLMKYLS